MATLLLIDDDSSLLDVLSRACEDAGHQVVTAPDGLMGWALVAEAKPELIVSDVNMPGLDGFSLCRRLRDSGSRLPFILLTSRDNEIDEALGLELGADDYVSKPFSPRVLLARVTALLRRETFRSGAVGTVRPKVVGPLELDCERIEVRWRGASVEVTVTEFRLLDCLAARPGVVFGRERLLRAIRDDDSVVAERIIDNYVRRLRRKFERQDGCFEHIETVIGAGYRWKEGARPPSQ